MKAAIDTLVSVAKGRKICCFGDMLELGDDTDNLHREVGEYAKEKHVDCMWTYGEKASFIAKGFGDGAEDFATKQELTDYVIKNLKAGDTIVLKRSHSRKFEDILDNPNIYKLFIFDKKNKKFDVITRKKVEDLTENFGFDYNNEVIDSYKEGDTIPKDTVFYNSTSYDEDMNYSYGKNVTVMYTLDPYTSEDAAVASESLAKEFTSIETEVITIGLNDNDYLVNLQGNKDEYKPLPDIGDVVSGHLAAVRRLFNNQLLYDFKSDTLNKIQKGDIVYYVDDNNEIIDYTIYNNSENMVDNDFTRQINKYIRGQEKYYKEIIETCEDIFDTGFDYSSEIDYLYKRAKDFIDKKKKWKEG